MTLYKGRLNEKMVFFVGGPMNGTTMFLGRDVTKYRMADTDTLEAVNNLKDDVNQLSFKSHLYREVKEMSADYYRGCFIFEWWEKS